MCSLEQGPEAARALRSAAVGGGSEGFVRDRTQLDLEGGRAVEIELGRKGRKVTSQTDLPSLDNWQMYVP